MSRINLNTRITLAQAAHGIATVGHQRTIILRGEPGIGKSWVLKTLGKQMPTHRTVYIDCQLLLDQGDFFYPHIEVTEAGGKVAKRVALEDFDFSDGTPLIVMLDEIGKSNKSVMNVLLTLMYDRRIGNNHLPEGSIVFGTTNMTSDGVGDFIAAHARSRAVITTVKKPHAGFNADGSVDADAWGYFALNNDIDPAITAWVKMNPNCLESYLDHTGGEKWDNPYAFHPTQGAESYVCPRSLHASSDIVKQRDVLGHELTLSLLAGAAGESFARSFSAFLMIQNKVATADAIAAAPESAVVPDAGDGVALCVTVLNLVSYTTTKSIDALVTYMKRLPSEYQALFARSLMANESKKDVAIKCEEFRKWSLANHWMF